MFGEDIDREMLADFIDESMETLNGIPALLVELERKPDALKIIEAVFRPIHSLKGNAAYFGMKRTKALTHEMESLLDALRKAKLRINKAIVDGLLSGVDTLTAIMGQARLTGTEPSDDGQVEALVKKFQKLIDEPAEVKVDLWDDVMMRIQEWSEQPFFAGAPEKSRLVELRSWLQELRSACVVPKNLHPVENLTVQMPRLAGDFSPFQREGEALLNLLLDRKRDVRQTGKEVGKRMEELAGLCPKGKAAELLTEARAEYDLFMSKIGFDDMLRDSLEETTRKLLDLAAQNAEPAAIASKPPEPSTHQPPAEIPIKAPAKMEAKLEPPVVKSVESLPLSPAGNPLSGNPPAGTAAPVAAATPASSASPGGIDMRKEREIARTMRVSEESIDSFLGFVGELIALDEMFRYIHQEMIRAQIDVQLCSSLLRVINSFSKLSDELQSSIMEIRKVSVKSMLQKAVRIARDVASEANKKVDVEVIGDEIMIDRSLIDTLEAPLVHLVRNATDHGIENTEQRLAAKKSETGKILLEMRETEDDIELRIRDDGRGLNYEKIRKKAQDLGLLTPDQQIRNQQLVNFIFSSGFSTADKITDISGRGVGLDAVKKAVEDAGGTITVNSEPSKGSEFLVRLPKTVGTQILNSFVVTIEGERFVVPMEKISRSFRPEREQIHRLPDGAVCIKRKDEIYPVVALNGIYNGGFDQLAQGLLLTIEGRGKPFGFLVDNIVGIQKVVLRCVPWIRVDKYLGAAVMGDGRVSMIVNLNLYEEMLL